MIESKGVFAAMADIGPRIVSSLVEAINQRDQYPGALAFMVAPLATKNGGKRSWHVLKIEGEGEEATAVGWCPESTEGAKLPPVTVDARELPELPPSKIGSWEVVFIDANSDLLGPRIRIEPGSKPQVEPSPAATAPPAPPASVASTGSTPPSSPPGTSAEILLEAFKAQINASQQSTTQMLAMVGAVTSSIEKIGKGHMEVQALLSAELKRANEQTAKAETDRDQALGANTELQGLLAESRENSQFYNTIQLLYKDKPELLMHGLKELTSGLLDRLSGRPE